MSKSFNFIISDEFRNVLSKFKDQSIFANLLLKEEVDCDLLVDNPVNYLSISSDIIKISYLTKERIETIDPSLYWTSSRRYCARPGAFLRKIFKDIKDSDVEKFSNLYRSFIRESDFKFKIVEGNDIAKYYYHEQYKDDYGSLGNSCMKHSRCQDFLKIYCENPDKIKMLILFEDDDDKIVGRALLWNLGNFNIMDRIYTINDDEYPIYFKKWATDNGYLYKSDQNWMSTLFFENLKTEKSKISIEVTLNNYNYNRYPYLDTFKFLNTETGVLKNYIEENDDYITLMSSEGDVLRDKYYIIDILDGYLRYKGDCVYLDYKKGYTSYSNVQFSKINDTYILTNDSIFFEKIGQYIFNELYDHLNNKSLIDEKLNEIEMRDKNNLNTSYEFTTDTPYRLYRPAVQTSEVDDVVRRNRRIYPILAELPTETIDNISRHLDIEHDELNVHVVYNDPDLSDEYESSSV